VEPHDRRTGNPCRLQTYDDFRYLLCKFKRNRTGEVPTSETQLIVKDPTGAVFYSTNISFFAVAAIAYQK